MSFLREIRNAYALGSKSSKRAFVSFLVFEFLVAVCVIYYAVTYRKTTYFKIPSRSRHDDDIRQFRLESSMKQTVGLLLDLPECQILNLPALDNSTKQVLDYINCDPNNQHWTYTSGSDLIINDTNLKESGYRFENISCCYTSMTRFEQSEKDYTKMADSLIKLSDECIVLEDISTLIHDEFIRVTCTLRGQSVPLYEKFHAFVLVEKNFQTRNKVKFWENSGSTVSKPPNGILIGVDSVSRLSSIRNLNKTREILKKYGGVEFLGFSKVGQNPLPNVVTHLNGYSHEYFAKICQPSQWSLQDSCPYIWREFDKFKYFTANIDDSPRYGSFNLMRTGFVKQPTDFYYRTFALGFEIHRAELDAHVNCIGHERIETSWLKYINDLIVHSKTAQVPLFLHSWLSSLTIANSDGIQMADQEFANFFKNLDMSQSNTILVFMSDHGYRRGSDSDEQELVTSPLEEKLPLFWIILSQDLKQKHPQWIKNLKNNSKKLTSPFDLYQTLADILKSTTSAKFDSQRSFGKSLISENVPTSRTCSDAGIPQESCPCLKTKQILAKQRKSAAHKQLN